MHPTILIMRAPPHQVEKTQFLEYVLTVGDLIPAETLVAATRKEATKLVD